MVEQSAFAVKIKFNDGQDYCGTWRASDAKVAYEVALSCSGYPESRVERYSVEATDIGARNSEAATRALLAELERELGVTGTAAVFRKALSLAKAARAALNS